MKVVKILKGCKNMKDVTSTYFYKGEGVGDKTPLDFFAILIQFLNN